MTLFHEQKLIHWVHALGFRGLVGLSTSRRKHKIFGARNNMVAVQTIMLDQNENEVDPLKIFKEQP